MINGLISNWKGRKAAQTHAREAQVRGNGVLRLQEAKVNEIAAGPVQSAALWDSSQQFAVDWS